MRELQNYPKWRPFALEVGAGNFALATGHPRIAISFAAGTLNFDGFDRRVDLGQPGGFV
jgi:hypothetical protein